MARHITGVSEAEIALAIVVAQNREHGTLAIGSSQKASYAASNVEKYAMLLCNSVRTPTLRPEPLTAVQDILGAKGVIELRTH